MSEFQKFLNQSLKHVNLKPIDDNFEIEEYDINADVSMLLVNARIAANLTQKQLAHISGVSQANISKIENGSYRPSLSTLKKIADALGKRLVVSFEDQEV